MPITTRQIDVALQEVERFFDAANKAKARLRDATGIGSPGVLDTATELAVRSAETAALRRASMDLTRSLAKLRKP